MEQTMVRLSQLAKITALLLLFFLVPFVPSSLRPPYLYLLFNALVLALGVQAGLLSVSGLREDMSSSSMSSPNLQTKLVNEAAATGNTVASRLSIKHAPWIDQLREVKVLADPPAIKDNAVVSVARKLKETIKKCPSRASIFFIGSVDPNDDGEVVDAMSSTAQKEEMGQKKWKVDGAAALSRDLMSKQELFTKAEDFIGNFYKQLKMQREESWNKLQDLYRYHHHYKTKAF